MFNIFSNIKARLGRLNLGKIATILDFTVFREHFAITMMKFPDFVSLAVTFLVLPIVKMKALIILMEI